LKEHYPNLEDYLFSTIERF